MHSIAPHDLEYLILPRPEIEVLGRITEDVVVFLTIIVLVLTLQDKVEEEIAHQLLFRRQ